MENRSSISDKYITIIFGVLFFAGLYITSLYSYMLFHSIAELLSIAAAWGVFMLAWNSRRYFENNYLLIISVSFLFVGAIDLLHTLAYKGMNMFLGYDANLPTQLWIVARYLQSLSLLIAPLFMRKKIRMDVLFSGYFIIISFLLASIFYWKTFPDCYIEGAGLTQFKKTSEYIISFIFAASIWLLLREKKEFERRVLQLLITSIIASILSEISFTTYVSVYGLSNLLGHFLKIISFYLLYKAIIETGIRRPYDLLFRNLKQSEEALKDSEGRYRLIAETSLDIIFQVDPQGIIAYCSPVVYKLGYTREEIVGRNFNGFLPSSELLKAADAFQKVISGEYIEQLELNILTKNGSQRPFEINAAPVIANEITIGIQGSARDITERKRAEEALRQSKEDLSRAQEVGSTGSWRLDVRRNVLTWSDENHRIFGIQKGTPMTYETFLSTVHPDDRAYVDTEWKAGLRGKPYDIEHRLVVDGQVKWVREKAYLESDRDGALLGGFGITQDITKRKYAEEALRLALVESERRQAKISALLSASRVVLERREFKDTARSIFDFCKNLIGATSGYVALSSSDGTENELVFLDPGELSCTVDHSLPMPIRGLRGEVYKTGRTAYNNNFSGSEYMKFIPEGHVRLDNVLFAPLIIKGYPVGLLGLANKPGGFADDDADMASAFSELAAVALYNSRLLETLQESEERFRSVVETACDGIISADSKGNVISWNKGAENIFGYAEDEIMGRPLTLIMPERFHEPHRIGFDRMASTCESQVAERILSFEGLRKDGSELPLELSIATWKTREGIFFTGIVRDVTERRKMEAVIKKAFEDMEEKVNERTIDLINANEDLEREIAERKRAEEALLETNVSLRESEKEYRKLSQEFHTLLNAIPDSIILLSPDMKMLWTNSGTASMLDMDRDDLTGHCCFEIWHNRTEPCEECPAVESFKTGKTETAQISTRKGRVFDIRAFPIKDENENVINVIVVTSEITEKINLQAEAMRTAHLASLGEMAAGIAHEINNPINGIINYAQILADRLESGRRENEIASQIIKEGDRVADIVRSLLSFARERKREKVPVYISDLLSDSFNLTGAQIRKDGIKLKVDIPDDLPEIMANSQQIQQVFLNIINNARYALNQKYPETDEDKVLEITAGKLMIDDKPYVRITFYDLGIGIPGDVLAKVVNPFFSTKPAGIGTGLGLSISHGIITDHNGKLTIKSLEGEFTNVIIDLPANTIGEE